MASGSIRPGIAGERHVADHIKAERELRGWSTGELARQVTKAGCPLSQSAVWRIENGDPPRKISVDELIAFGVVFNKPIEALLKPMLKEFPEDLLRLYVNKWVEALGHVRTQEVRARIDLGKVTAAAWQFPAAEPLIREMIAERVGVAGLVNDYLAEFDKGMQFTRESRGEYSQLSPAEIILLGRSHGKSDDEVKREAAGWGALTEVEEALRTGVVHHTEKDFAGWMPLEFLEIRDGRVLRKATAGRAAEAEARATAREHGLKPT